MNSIYFVQKKGQALYYSELAKSQANPHGLTSDINIANIYTSYGAEEKRIALGSSYDTAEEDLKRFMDKLSAERSDFSGLDVIEEIAPGFIDEKSQLIDKIYSNMESEGIEFDEMPFDIAIQILIEAGINYGTEEFFDLLKEKNEIANIYDALLDSGIKVTITDFRNKNQSA